MKKFICILIILIMSVSLFIPTYADVDDNKENGSKSSQSLTEIINNNTYTLSVDIDTANIYIKDNLTDKIWSSNPQIENNELYNSGMKDMLMSQIRVSFLDDLRNIVTVNSYEGCVLKSNHEIRKYKKNGKIIGVKIIYNFKEDSQKFKIPVAIVLTQSGFESRILFDEIEEYGTSSVVQIDLLPVFSCGTLNDEGYLFIPDGSGAIVDFKDIVKNSVDYEANIYGNDPSLNMGLKYTQTNQSVKMPIFGIKKGNDAFLAIIKKGDAISKIKATSSQDKLGCSAVYASFYYREDDETGLVGKDTLVRTVHMADSKKTNLNPVVEYIFLHNEDANYSGMARAYRSYLTSEYKLRLNKQSGSAVTPMLEVFGKSYKSAEFLGIPYKKSVNATTVSQLNEIYNSLEKKGVKDLNIGLIGFEKGGFQNKYSKTLNIDRSLGSKSKLKTLVDNCNNADFYIGFDISHQYSNLSSGLGSDKFIHGMNGISITKYSGHISTGAWDKTKSWKLLNVDAIKKMNKSYLSNIKKEKDIGVMYLNIGDELYNDFSDKKPNSRQDFCNSYQSVLKDAKNSLSGVASEGGNIYTLYSSDLLCEIPLGSSNHIMFSNTVPFYSIVLHGLVKLSSESLNDSENITNDVLKCAQLGIMPTYRLTGCRNSNLRETNLSFLYNSKYTNWIDKIAENQNIINDSQKGLENVLIYSHEQKDDLSIIKYCNGKTAVINLGQKSAIYQGQQISPKVIRVFD